MNDEITIDLNHSKTSVHIIKPATLDNSYFIETFVYRGLPTKYLNLDYDTIIRTELKGPRRLPYDPNHEDENQNNDEMETNSVHSSVQNSVYGLSLIHI